MRYRSVAAIALIAAIVGFATSARYHAVRWETTAMRLSPDGQHRILMEDLRLFFQIDRNFRLTLELLDHEEKNAVVFRSPDEGSPIGTERFVWSSDSSHVLLLGREFFVREGSTLGNGEQLYFMLNLNTGEAWCNNSEQTKLPRFSKDEVRAVEWEFPLPLLEQSDGLEEHLSVDAE